MVPLQLLEDASVTETSSSSESDNEDLSTVEDQGGVTSPAGISIATPDKDSDTNQQLDDQSVDRLSSGSDATLPYCDNSDSNSNVSSRDVSRDSSPYPSCSDLNLRFSSQIDRSSDVSQESSPCMSPADFSVRRSARLDRSSDTSRDASPLIFDSDFGLRRSSRNRARLKNIPPLKATRNLSSFLFDENSASNSSMAGENSLLGIRSSLFKDDSLSRRSSKSSELTEDSDDCDIHANKLFENSKTLDTGSKLSASFHGLLDKVNKSDNGDKLENTGTDNTDNDDIGDDNVKDDDDDHNVNESCLTDENLTEDEKSICKEVDNVNNNNENSEKLFGSEIKNSSAGETNVMKVQNFVENNKEFSASETEVVEESNIESEDVNDGFTGKVHKDRSSLSDNECSNIENVDMLLSEKVKISDVTEVGGITNDVGESVQDIKKEKNFIDFPVKLLTDSNDCSEKTNHSEEVNMKVDESESAKEKEGDGEEVIKSIKVNDEESEMKKENLLEDDKVQVRTEVKNELVIDKLETNIKVESDTAMSVEVKTEGVTDESKQDGVKDTSEKIEDSEKVKMEYNSVKIKPEYSKREIKTESDILQSGDTIMDVKDIKPGEGDKIEKLEESEEEEEEEEKVRILKFYFLNHYPARTDNDKPLPPV